MYLDTGSGGKGLERLSLSAEDLVMAMHKASSRRIEVLSRTTGNVDQVGSFPVVLILAARGLKTPREGSTRLAHLPLAVDKNAILRQACFSCLLGGGEKQLMYGLLRHHWHPLTLVKKEEA